MWRSRYLFNTGVVRYALMLCLALCLLTPGRAWVEPGGSGPETADLAQLNTHGRLLVDAIALLRRDNRQGTADACTRYLQQLASGARAADAGGGSFTVAVGLDRLTFFQGTFAKNSMQHFYRWEGARNRGFKGLYIFQINQLVDPALLRPLRGASDVELLRGPHPDAASLADWHYAQAMQAMRAGEPETAYFELGYALHLVQDLCVPHHARNTILSGHERFEVEANRLLAANRLPADPPEISGDYHDGDSAAIFVARAAGISFSAFSNAKSDDAVRRRNAMTAMLRLARQLGAGLLSAFHAGARTKAYSMTRVTIDRVRALRDLEAYEAYSAAGADFTAEIAILSEDGTRWLGPHDGNRAARMPVLNGFNDCRPNRLGALWAVTSLPTDETMVRIILRIMEDDRRAGNPDDQVDITPDPATSELQLLYDLRSGVARVLSANGEAGDPLAQTGAPGHFLSRGRDGLVEFTIEGLYLPGT